MEKPKRKYPVWHPLYESPPYYVDGLCVCCHPNTHHLPENAKEEDLQAVR